MAKTTKHGGASDKTLPVPAAVVQTEEPLTVKQADEVREAVLAGDDPLPHGATGGLIGPDLSESLARLGEEGGESSSPGSSSSASTPKQPTTSEPSKPATQSRARRTGNRSAKGRTESSTASGTAGVPETGTSETDGE
jgi:hypothetical protein